MLPPTAECGIRLLRNSVAFAVPTATALRDGQVPDLACWTEVAFKRWFAQKRLLLVGIVGADDVPPDIHDMFENLAENAPMR